MGGEKDRMKLLHKINEASFAMDETRLFLDTHPKCEEALAYYNNMCHIRQLHFLPLMILVKIGGFVY